MTLMEQIHIYSIHLDQIHSRLYLLIHYIMDLL
nr:MAG TPA: hypothetical protein [Bacteriophage sp.]